tara:strand:- start:212 stop:400 length:189 start_codon:yes stop_codon:yes gene_type:complete
MITVSIQETRRGYLEFETQEDYQNWVDAGEDVDCFTQEESSTTIVHPDGSETGDYSDSPQNW